MARWVWVVGPSCYLDEHGAEHPKLDPGGPRMRWACHRDTRRGDLAVLYRSQRAKDIAHLFRVTGDAVAADEDGAAHPWNCEAEVMARFPDPVPLRAMRDDPVIAAWPALRASFVRTGAAVPDDVWRRLLELAGSVPLTPDTEG